MENNESVSQLERGFLTGKLLVAMPHIDSPYYEQAVIYVCGHDETGAMGIMVNKPLLTVTFTDLLEQLEIDCPDDAPELPIYYGGPVEVGRGFVLHTADYMVDSSTIIDSNLALTATLDILRATAIHHGPQSAIMALGYVGWGAFQLEQEIHSNMWIVIDGDVDLIFEKDIGRIWETAMASIGITPSRIAIECGHA